MARLFQSSTLDAYRDAWIKIGNIGGTQRNVSAMREYKLEGDLFLNEV